MCSAGLRSRGWGLPGGAGFHPRRAAEGSAPTKPSHDSPGQEQKREARHDEPVGRGCSRSDAPLASRHAARGIGVDPAGHVRERAERRPVARAGEVGGRRSRPAQHAPSAIVGALGTARSGQALAVLIELSVPAGSTAALGIGGLWEGGCDERAAQGCGQRPPAEIRVRRGLHSESSPGPPLARRILAFSVPGGLVVLYALRGGSYDIVVRQELGFAVWVAVAAAVAAGLLPRVLPTRFAIVPLVGILALTGWTALSLTWTGSAERTVAEVARLLHYLGLVALVWAFVGRNTWRHAAAGLAAGACAVTALALSSRLFPGAFPEPQVGRISSLDRLDYPFSYWNAVGAWAAMSLAMALAWSGHAQRTLVRAAFLSMVPVCTAAIYLTYSRAAVGGAAVAVLAAVGIGRNRWVTFVHALVAAAAGALVIAAIRDNPAIAEAGGTGGAGAVIATLAAGALACAAAAFATRALGGDRRWRLPAPYGRVAVAAGFVVVMLLGVSAARDPVSDAWSEFRTQPVASAPSDPAQRLSNFSGARYGLWQSAQRAFEDSPGRGIGAGTFEFWWNGDGGRDYARDAHMLYLETLAELGVPGGLFLLLFLGGLLGVAAFARGQLRRRRSTGAAAALIGAFLVFLLQAGLDWMWETTAVAALALGAAAVCIASTAERRVRLPVPARALLAGLALALAFVQVPGLRAVSHVRSSQAAVREGDLSRAAQEAERAVDAAGFSTTALIQRGLVAEARGRLRPAARDLAEAARKEPLNWRPRLLLARVRVQQGREKDALADYRAARRLRPASPFFERPALPPSTPPG